MNKKMKDSVATKLIAKCSIKSEKKYITAVTTFMRSLAIQNGLDEKSASHLEVITEEACLNVIQHAFENSPDKIYDLSFEKIDSRLKMSIHDSGLPLDWDALEKAENLGIGMKLMRGLASEIRFINLGKEGKCLEFFMDLAKGEPDPSGFMEGSQSHDDIVDTRQKTDDPVTFRMLVPEDAVNLAKCMYRVYGFTYKDVVYFPEKIRQFVSSGLLVSMVAVNSKGEIVGHQGLRKGKADASVAEITMGAVDPRYRGRGIFEKLKELSFAHIRTKGVYGLYLEAVANHPYSQKANLAMGARETGILLGFIQGNVDFISFDNSKFSNSRLSVVLGYNRLEREPVRTVFLPESHQEIMKEIYSYGGFVRKFVREEILPRQPEVSQVDVSMFNDSRIAFIRIHVFGMDLIKVLKYRLREIFQNEIEVAYLDYNLSDRAGTYYVKEIEKLGFFFSGIIPELDNGDIIRFGFLGSQAIDKDNIVLVSDFAKKILEYIWDEYQLRNN